MVRTKADCGGTYRKVVAARAPRKVLGSSSVNAGPSQPPPAKRELAPCHQILQKMARRLKKSRYDPSLTLIIDCASPVLELVFVQLYIFLSLCSAIV
ncbi:PCNA-associated factor isoform X2 [Apteryx mantelli]|uniref:PCNA-associated factor isoform X2 n=1 Tax=Apteryx mantelli TaxID=2696672 RepID=A0ABM4F988_9AVES